MPSAKFNALAAPAARTMNIIWAAMLAAPFIYLFVGWIMTRTPMQTNPDLPAALIGAVFLLVGTLLVIASTWYQRQALSDARLKAVMAAPAGGAVPAAAAGLEPVERRLARLLPHYQTVMIVTLALREALAVLGLVLVILTGNFLLMVPWAMAAVGLITIQPPRVTALLDRATPLARSLG
jgi:F0F1-type ATP synthase membrane subunit c/vacuolar-type H+-ATPase subunit K